MKCAHDSTFKKAEASTEAQRKTECIDLRFQFPKFGLVRSFTLSFYYTGQCTEHLMKKAIN